FFNVGFQFFQQFVVRGFEPTHAFTRLTVFKTVPFSQTWVILQLINLLYHFYLKTTKTNQLSNKTNTF
ncbi:hypothetical protein FDX20_27625, partial [Citrobacter sp. TBCS-11]